MNDRELAAVFRLFDANNDGLITPVELRRMLGSLAGVVSAASVDQLLNLAALQGAIDIDSFREWATGQPPFEVVRNLRELFTLIDADGSGCLCVDEMAVLVGALDAALEPSELASLLARHDIDGNGSLSYDEFVRMVVEEESLAISLADLKRIRRSLIQYAQASRASGLALVEVDCDLGAGIPGAASGIQLLRQAAERQQALRRVAERLLREIHAPPGAGARGPGQDGGAAVTPHAKHIRGISAIMADAAELVASSLTRGLFPVVLAGDHSTAAGTLAGIRRAFPRQRIGVVWIDAHADLHSPYTSPSGNMHGMPLAIASGYDNAHHRINDPDAVTRQLWEHCKSLAGADGPSIRLRDVIYVSLRDTEPAEEAAIRSHGIAVVDTAEVRRNGPEQAAARCLEVLGDCDRLYVSFDVDSIDAALCKGTGTPVPDGILPEEAQALHRALLRDPRVCCWEICEINPHLDTLNSIAEISLGVYSVVLEELDRRHHEQR